MLFDPENEIVKLCAQGMEMEGMGKITEATGLYQQAWLTAQEPWEKFTAAHYIARHQPNIQDKLNWNKTALNHALESDSRIALTSLPSLFLNVAKDYEDLGDLATAKQYYEKAKMHREYLDIDGYGQLISNGIRNGLERIESRQSEP